MNNLTDKIFYSWVDKQPDMPDKGFLSHCASHQSKIEKHPLLSAIEKFKSYYGREKECFYCTRKSAYIHGKYVDGNLIWHCVQSCGKEL